MPLITKDIHGGKMIDVKGLTPGKVSKLDRPQTVNNTSTPDKKNTKKTNVKDNSRIPSINAKMFSDNIEKVYGKNGLTDFTLPTKANKIQNANAHAPILSNTNPTAGTGGVNGLIDEEVTQGNTGDCWLISGIYSLVSTERGRDILQSSIQNNNDGSVTVNFRGINAEYTLSSQEINEHDTDDIITDAYTNGDNDMLVIELATEKLWNDINSGAVQLNTTNEDLLFAGFEDGNGVDDGGLPNQMAYYFTGVESEEYFNDDLSNLDSNTINSILQNAYTKGNTVLDAVIYFNEHSAQLTNGKNYTLDVGEGGHSISITNVTQNTVTIVNPWDTSSSYEMSWSEFAKLGVGYIASTDLNSVNVPSNEAANNTTNEVENDNTSDVENTGEDTDISVGDNSETTNIIAYPPEDSDEDEEPVALPKNPNPLNAQRENMRSSMNKFTHSAGANMLNRLRNLSNPDSD